MTINQYKEISDTVAQDPGVYQFFDKNDTVIYVGKAKNLKKRLNSYFRDPAQLTPKTRTMVKNAQYFKFTIVESEMDALLLENSMIKKFQPRYNILLKDGKSYSYICVKNENFPRVFLTRNVIKDGSHYFGPYTSMKRIKALLALIKQLFPLRTCNLNLSEANINKGKFDVCLEYHIKKCKGPCVGYEPKEVYDVRIEQIKNILKGRLSLVKKHFVNAMNIHAENLDFEKAQAIKDKLIAFDDYQSKSTVVSTTIADVDVFGIETGEDDAFVSYLKIIDGAIVNSYTVEVKKGLDEPIEDILSYVIADLRDKFNSITPEIIVPFKVFTTNFETNIVIPKIGDKKKLLELASQNAKFQRLQMLKLKATKVKKQTSVERIMKTLKSDLQMEVMPFHIECFDNSNMQGSYPVSSCVVFKNAKPSKKDYRHFNVKTVEGPNDFASMTEVVFRRYSRLLKENKPLPQLIIVDGGKGQLSATMKSIEALGLENTITVVGIAKRLEEIFFPNDSIPLYINKKSESLKLMQHLRNEAHRFAITFHRDQRSRNFLVTELTNIRGIGLKTAQKLLKHYGSVQKIKETELKDLIDNFGNSIAQKVYTFFNPKE